MIKIYKQLFVVASIFFTNSLVCAEYLSIRNENPDGYLLGMGRPEIIKGYIDGYVRVASNIIKPPYPKDPYCNWNTHEWKFTDLSGKELGYENVNDNKGFLIHQKLTISVTCNYALRLNIIAKGDSANIKGYAFIDGVTRGLDPVIYYGINPGIFIPRITFHHSLEYTIEILPKK